VRRCNTHPFWFGFETMQKLPLAALRAFAAVYEMGGVRAAARTLRVTHSAVSRQLRELEKWLGVALFEQRDGSRRMILTPQAQALGRAALAGLVELERAVEGVRELRRPNSVLVATTASFAARWLIPRLPLLQKSHPWIELSIVTQQSVRHVAEQGADLALRMGSGPWPDAPGEAVMDDALFPVATRRYWSGIGERQPARALAKARLLHDRDPAAAWERWFSEHPSRAVDLRTGSRFTSTDLVLRAAAQGLGVALARAQLVAEELAAGELFRPFGSAQVSLPRAYWLMGPATADARPAVRAVVEWLKTQASGSPP
jgi:LysR family transcriptional regulator, glycine cleavage system transcriptional activator